jgi:molybdate transport system permease protein
MALTVVVPSGMAVGWWLARGRTCWQRTLVDALVVLPMVLPPSVTGFYLLILLGRRGALGQILENWFHIRLVFTSLGAAIAASVVAFPLMAKGAEAAFSRVDRELEDIARVHGLSSFNIFREVTLPLARSGLTVALTLTTLRALGEFGATLVFAGYVSGETDTAPLEIFMALQAGEDHRAGYLVLALSVLSLTTTFFLARSNRREISP